MRSTVARCCGLSMSGVKWSIASAHHIHPTKQCPKRTFPQVAWIRWKALTCIDANLAPEKRKVAGSIPALATS
jgi:hypothetical protein